MVLAVSRLEKTPYLLIGMYAPLVAALPSQALTPYAEVQLSNPLPMPQAPWLAEEPVQLAGAIEKEPLRPSSPSL